MLVSRVVVLSILIVVADGRDVEELHVIIEANPEATVILVHQVYLTLRRFGPLRRLVAPIALPLNFAPGVPDLNQALLLAVVKGDHFGSD